MRRPLSGGLHCSEVIVMTYNDYNNRIQSSYLDEFIEALGVTHFEPQKEVTVRQQVTVTWVVLW